MNEDGYLIDNFEDIANRALDEYLRKQDQDEERRNLQALYVQGEFQLDD